MCGITGIINPEAKGAIEKMTRAISHRGPDDEGYFTDEFAALGMRRLSIIDLARGKQPISSTDDRYLIFFNGEIYNYKEIKDKLNDYEFKTDSDTEVILAGFIKWGEEVLSHLRGMFTFAIYDKEQHKIFLARDFFGIKPLYYVTAAGFQNLPALPSLAGLRHGSNFENTAAVIAFSSEIKSFLALPGFKPEVNDKAVVNYLSYQYNPLEETFFKHVFKLPPASFMTIDAETGEAEVKRYWHFEFKSDNSLDEGKTADRILEVMKDSVAHHMIADVPVGSFLSGGIDSSIIATLMQQHLETGFPSGSSSSQKVKTFTVGFEFLSEGLEAKETSEPLGTDHTEITVGAEEYFKVLPKAAWHFDEPVADPSAIGLYFLAREAVKHVKVVLSGEGADELFGGYNIYLEPFARRRLAWMPRFILKFFTKLPFEFKGKNYFRRVLGNMEERYIGNASVFSKEEVKELWRATPQEFVSIDNLYAEARNLSDSTKMQYIDINTWLVGDILAKADKMTMAHSLELRVPFLDTEVARLAATLPDRFKWRGGATKYLLRKAFEKILPETVRRRKKLGFPTPVKTWFTAKQSDAYQTILENPYIRSHLNVKRIEELISEHLSGRHDNSRKIYLLLMLAIWYNVF
ncbi:MAG: asparagine synthase (glutamine-hydrolyzing), partial [bacterium]|nr:asparagine synthase (glutamine-hydrolyzing) [bacterium]